MSDGCGLVLDQVMGERGNSCFRRCVDEFGPDMMVELWLVEKKLRMEEEEAVPCPDKAL